MDACAPSLRRVEGRMDWLFQQLIDDLDEAELLQSSERFDELVSTYSELRVHDLDRYADRAWAMLSCFDFERGPLPGFDEAMEALCKACLTPHVVYGLRSALYTVAARVVDDQPDLLPTVAIASLSLKGPNLLGNAFVEMVLYASALEWLVIAGLSDDDAWPDMGGDQARTGNAARWRDRRLEA